MKELSRAFQLISEGFAQAAEALMTGEETESPAPQKAKELTLKDLQSLGSQVIKAGRIEALKALLKANDYPNLSSVPKGSYEFVSEKLKELRDAQ